MKIHVVMQSGAPVAAYLNKPNAIAHVLRNIKNDTHDSGGHAIGLVTLPVGDGEKYDALKMDTIREPEYPADHPVKGDLGSVPL